MKKVGGESANSALAVVSAEILRDEELLVSYPAADATLSAGENVFLDHNFYDIIDKFFTDDDDEFDFGYPPVAMPVATSEIAPASAICFAVPEEVLAEKVSGRDIDRLNIAFVDPLFQKKMLTLSKAFESWRMSRFQRKGAKCSGDSLSFDIEFDKECGSKISAKNSFSVSEAWESVSNCNCVLPQRTLLSSSSSSSCSFLKDPGIFLSRISNEYNDCSSFPEKKPSKSIALMITEQLAREKKERIRQCAVERWRMKCLRRRLKRYHVAYATDAVNGESIKAGSRATGNNSKKLWSVGRQRESGGRFKKATIKWISVAEFKLAQQQKTVKENNKT